MNSYLTPDGFGRAELTEKRSRFIGRVWPVESEEEARARIEETKKQHYDARHNCWCYLLREGGTQRYSDDGEPQGTAGQPMLNVFQSGGLTDLCCVVTRYFGGVLLGAGGLVRAYSAAAKLALDAAGVRRMAHWQRLMIPAAYGQFDRLRRLLEDYGAVVEETDFGADILITALLQEEQSAPFRRALTELTAGTVEAETLEALYRGVRVSPEPK